MPVSGSGRLREGGFDLFGQLAFQLLDDGAEQALLVGVVVVQRAAGDAGRAGDLVRRDGLVTAGGEQFARGGDQGGLGAGGTVLLGTSHPPNLP